MSRPPDEYPTAVIELKLEQAIRRIDRRRRKDRLNITPPSPPCPIRVMTIEEQEEYDSNTPGSLIGY